MVVKNKSPQDEGSPGNGVRETKILKPKWISTALKYAKSLIAGGAEWPISSHDRCPATGFHP